MYIVQYNTDHRFQCHLFCAPSYKEAVACSRAPSRPRQPQLAPEIINEVGREMSSGRG